MHKTPHYNGALLMKRKKNQQTTNRIFWKFKCYIFEAITDNMRKQMAQFPFYFHSKGQKSRTPLANLKNVT